MLRKNKTEYKTLLTKVANYTYKAAALAKSQNIWGFLCFVTPNKSFFYWYNTVQYIFPVCTQLFFHDLSV